MFGDGADACCGRRTWRSSAEGAPVVASTIGGEIAGGGVGGRICVGVCVGMLRACCSAGRFLWSAAVCNAEVISLSCFSNSDRFEAGGAGGGACCGGEVGVAE